MSILRDFQKQTVQDFRGPWPLLEAGDVPITNALAAQNVEYLPGLVKTRFGFLNTGNVPTLLNSTRVGPLFNWMPVLNGSPFNILAVPLVSSTFQLFAALINLSTTNQTLTGNPMTSIQAVGASFVSAGPRLYYTGFDINGNNTSVLTGPQVIAGYDGTHAAGAAPLFYSANDFGILAADGAAGVVTAGPHNILAIVTNSSGFTGFPQPYSHTSVYTTPFVASSPQYIAAGSKNTQVSLVPNSTWMAGFSSPLTRTVQIAMTRADNLARYYLVPGATASLPNSGSATIAITVNISDDVLAATGADATPFFSKVTFPGDGSIFAPVDATVLVEYNNRMVYVATDLAGIPVVYVSDEDAYQSLSFDQHIIYLPGQRRVTTCFVLGRTLFLVGPHWTYFSQDTGDVAVLWPTPSLVDGSIGTLSPLGVTVNGSKGFAWVADVNGLYMFQGAGYAPRPISYYQAPVWARINWQAAATVAVVDNAELKRVYVLAPLDGATSPNYILTWDYTRGLTPEDVSFSLDSIAGSSVAAIGIVQNDTTKRMETWLETPVNATAIMRYGNSSDTNPYRDAGSPILSLYQTALLPGLDAEVLQHHGDHLRLQGAGTTHISAQTLDGGRSLTLDTVLESGAPAQLYLRRYHALSEAMSLTFSTSDLDAWFQLSELTHYYTGFLAQR
jgi:hypothetical protein